MGAKRREVYTRIMQEPSITLEKHTGPSADEVEGNLPDTYIATYRDEHVGVLSRQGSTWGEALEALYQNLEQLGYDHSNLPKPEHGETH